ncbi:MAG TPA: chemotaxis protein CheW [Nocardioidaceae bacterium]|nr:chemotaxis protein CheW [Nocardioidaceae bacterium]
MSHQYCTFVLDGHLFGVPVSSVQEVLKPQALTHVPLAPAEVAGLINLRGQIVTTLELRNRLGLPRRDPGSPSVNVVVRTGDGGTVSLVVDEIGDVLEPDEDTFETPPETVPARIRALVTGVCKLQEHLMLALDTERAVSVESAA